MKKLLILLAAVLVPLGIFSACKGGGEEVPTEPPHKHTFATEWSYDESAHWYAANCGHEMQANVATHSDEDKDGICDGCAWDYDHEHTYAEEWSYDDTNHWHASSCNHLVKQDEAAHADADNNGICDGCAWDYGHEHTYASAWSHDADNHWHAVTCGHDVEVKGTAPHADADNNGICDGCTWDYDHTHTYAEAWSHDAENHWKDTDCGHAVVSEKAPHTDEDEDGICEGCAWDYDHEHTYASGDSWSINDTHHWYAATCGHNIDGIEMATHVDADENEACDVCSYDYNHEHEFDTSVWAHDKKSHYHAAVCGHAVRADEEAHKDADNDGICDVCLWDYDHTHEFSTDWTHDKNNHWHAATCTHSVKSGEEGHMDANNDGVCDVCLWDYDHTHTYDQSTWIIGTDTHYYKPNCGHDPQYVRGEETKHDDKNRDDKCDTCGGYVSLEVVVDYATSQNAAEQIKSGVISLIFAASGYQGSVNYEFGDHYLHIKDHQTYSGFENNYEYWYDLGENGVVFAIAQEDGDPFRNMGAESIFMKGYYFSGEFINYAFNSYGVEELLYQLYGMHLSADYAAACTDYREFYDQKTGMYSFYFGYSGLSVSVSFKIDENCSITYLKFVSGTSGNPEENVVEVTQTIGKRDAVNPYDPDVILINSYDIVDSNGQQIKDGDVIHMVTGSNYKLDLQVVNMLPTTANGAFDRVHIGCNDESALLTFAGTGGNMIINAQKEGTYTVTFSTEKLVKTITIIATYPAPTSIMGQVYDANGAYGTYSEYTMYLGDVMHFIAGVAAQTDGRYTAAITQNAANATLAETTIEILREPIAVTAFTPSALGDYVITITSVADPSVSCTLTVHVVEKNGPADILQGEWVYLTTWKVVFTPESEGALKGTVEITNTPKTGDPKSAVYIYEYKADGIQLTYVSGDKFNVKLGISADFRVKIGSWTMSRPE